MEESIAVSVTEIFNLQTLDWSQGEDLPVGIFQGASVQFKDSFLLVGGESEDAWINTIYYFNPQDQKWEKRNETMKQGRRDFAAFLVPNSLANCE